MGCVEELQRIGDPTVCSVTGRRGELLTLLEGLLTRMGVEIILSSSRSSLRASAGDAACSDPNTELRARWEDDSPRIGHATWSVLESTLQNDQHASPGALHMQSSAPSRRRRGRNAERVKRPADRLVRSPSNPAPPPHGGSAQPCRD
jgi:hypothetical protein